MLTSADKPINAAAGTEFRLYGYNLDETGKRLIIRYDVRRKDAAGSRIIGCGSLDETFPNSRTGLIAAGLRVDELNVAEANRLRAKN